MIYKGFLKFLSVIFDQRMLKCTQKLVEQVHNLKDQNAE